MAASAIPSDSFIQPGDIQQDFSYISTCPSSPSSSSLKGPTVRSSSSPQGMQQSYAVSKKSSALAERDGKQQRETISQAEKVAVIKDKSSRYPHSLHRSTSSPPLASHQTPPGPPLGTKYSYTSLEHLLTQKGYRDVRIFTPEWEREKRRAQVQAAEEEKDSEEEGEVDSLLQGRSRSPLGMPERRFNPVNVHAGDNGDDDGEEQDVEEILLKLQDDIPRRSSLTPSTDSQATIRPTRPTSVPPPVPVQLYSSPTSQAPVERTRVTSPTPSTASTKDWLLSSLSAFASPRIPSSFSATRTSTTSIASAPSRGSKVRAPLAGLFGLTSSSINLPQKTASSQEPRRRKSSYEVRESPSAVVKGKKKAVDQQNQPPSSTAQPPIRRKLRTTRSSPFLNDGKFDYSSDTPPIPTPAILSNQSVWFKSLSKLLPTTPEPALPPSPTPQSILKSAPLAPVTVSAAVLSDSRDFKSPHSTFNAAVPKHEPGILSPKLGLGLSNMSEVGGFSFGDDEEEDYGSGFESWVERNRMADGFCHHTGNEELDPTDLALSPPNTGVFLKGSTGGGNLLHQRSITSLRSLLPPPSPQPVSLPSPKTVPIIRLIHPDPTESEEEGSILSLTEYDWDDPVDGTREVDEASGEGYRYFRSLREEAEGLKNARLSSKSSLSRMKGKKKVVKDLQK